MAKDIKKILLVEPKAPGVHVYSAFGVPRLGLPLMGRILRGQGYSVEVYVEGGEPVPMSALREADLVGVSSTTSTAVHAYKIASLARDMGKAVVMGGPHVTFEDMEAADFCDAVVRGEGELTFPELIETMRNGGDLGSVAGISFLDGGTLVRTADRPLIPNLDSLPAPDLASIKGGVTRIVPIQTSRGCPYHCTFCTVTQMFGHKYRFRSTETILDEMQRYNGRRIFIIDDNFTAIPKRSIELLTRMKESGIRFKSWSAQTRVDIAHNPELMELMRESNCSRVYIGFESVNPKTLERFNKKQDVDDIRESVAALHRHRIRVHGMFVLGADDDTPETMRETIRFVDRTRIDTVQFIALVPLPGTQTTRELRESGRIISNDWSLYDGHHVVFRPAGMSPYQLHRAIYKGMLSFYSWRKALAYAVRFDEVNAILRIMGNRLVRRAGRTSADFTQWLKNREAWLSEWKGRQGFEFDPGSVREKLVRFKNRISGKDGEFETHQLKISSAQELRSRAKFITFKGFIDRKRARLIKRRVKKLARGHSGMLVLDFQNVDEITPDAAAYLARKFSRYQHIRMKLIGATGSLREKLVNLPRTVPGFELIDSVDSLRRNMPV